MRDELIDKKVGDSEFELSLRPRFLYDFIGQNKIKEMLKVYIQAAKKRDEALDHVILSGPPGLGKTTLAHIIANELAVNIRSTSGPILEKPVDLTATLTNLSKGDVLFIDEIHRLKHIVEEIMYPALEDYELDIIVGDGPAARSIKLKLPAFTLIGATTREGLISAPLRDRFGVNIRIDFYPVEHLKLIILRSAKILNILITENGAQIIAGRSRGTPRIANKLLRRIRDYAQVKYDGTITSKVADEVLNILEIDNLGLDTMDRRILETIIKKYNGGPVGLNTIAVSVGEESDTIEEVYEPFLIQLGFIKRTPQGRKITLNAIKHLQIEISDAAQKTLF